MLLKKTSISMDRKIMKTVLIILFKSLKKDSNALQKIMKVVHMPCASYKMHIM